MSYAHFSSDCPTSLADVQDYMRDMTACHGFTDNPHTQMTLIVEEVGELARVVKRVSRGQLDPADYACREEFADVLITVAGLANILGVDLAEAFRAKAAVNASRTWDLGTEGVRLMTAPTTWSDAVAPGGMVCAAPMPDRPNGICGMPAESEPCREHNPGWEG